MPTGSCRTTTSMPGAIPGGPLTSMPWLALKEVKGLGFRGFGVKTLNPKPLAVQAFGAVYRESLCFKLLGKNLLT